MSNARRHAERPLFDGERVAVNLAISDDNKASNTEAPEDDVDDDAIRHKFTFFLADAPRRSSRTFYHGAFVTPAACHLRTRYD